MKYSADGRFIYLDKDGEELHPNSDFSEIGRFSYMCRSKDPNAKSRCDINCKHPGGYDIPQRNWELTGSIDRPNISPSINCGECGWHGYIKEGVFLNTNNQPEAEQ